MLFFDKWVSHSSILSWNYMDLHPFYDPVSDVAPDIVNGLCYVAFIVSKFICFHIWGEWTHGTMGYGD